MTQNPLLWTETKKCGETREHMWDQGQIFLVRREVLWQIYIYWWEWYTTERENDDAGKWGYCQSMPLPGWGRDTKKEQGDEWKVKG